MSSPAQLQSETVYQGETWFWNFEIQDKDGQPVDMTVAGRRMYAKFLHESGTPTNVKDTDVPADVEWLDQGGGIGRFVTQKTDSIQANWPTGRYTVDAIYDGIDVTPPFVRVKGEQEYFVREPRTGAIT